MVVGAWLTLASAADAAGTFEEPLAAPLDAAALDVAPAAELLDEDEDEDEHPASATATAAATKSTWCERLI
jgi:hypothetical protein